MELFLVLLGLIYRKKHRVLPFLTEDIWFTTEVIFFSYFSVLFDALSPLGKIQGSFLVQL